MCAYGVHRPPVLGSGRPSRSPVAGGSCCVADAPPPWHDPCGAAAPRRREADAAAPPPWRDPCGAAASRRREADAAAPATRLLGRLDLVLLRLLRGLCLLVHLEPRFRGAPGQVEADPRRRTWLGDSERHRSAARAQGCRRASGRAVVLAARAPLERRRARRPRSGHPAPRRPVARRGSRLRSPRGLRGRGTGFQRRSTAPSSAFRAGVKAPARMSVVRMMAASEGLAGQPDEEALEQRHGRGVQPAEERRQRHVDQRPADEDVDVVGAPAAPRSRPRPGAPGASTRRCRTGGTGSPPRARPRRPRPPPRPT